MGCQPVVTRGNGPAMCTVTPMMCVVPRREEEAAAQETECLGPAPRARKPGNFQHLQEPRWVCHELTKREQVTCCRLPFLR